MGKIRLEDKPRKIQVHVVEQQNEFVSVGSYEFEKVDEFHYLG